MTEARPLLFACYYGPNLILFHLHPDVRSPVADACVVDIGAVEIMMGKNGVEVPDVALTAGGLGGVVAAIRSKIIIT